MESNKTDYCPTKSVQDLRRCLENEGVLFLELGMPRRVGKTTMLNALALGYSQIKDNRVLLITHNPNRSIDSPLIFHDNIDIISLGRIKHSPNFIQGIKYEVILIDEIHGFSISELVHNLRLNERAHTLKAFVMVR